MRCATISGLWYGSETTPVPRRMRRVRSAAAAMNSSGEAIDLEPGGMMLADPRLLEAEPVEPFDQFEVLADQQRRVLVHRVIGGEEDAAAERAVGHGRLVAAAADLAPGAAARARRG